MTINRSWGYNASDTRWKSAQELIRNLSDIASKGGNYLLNVGPTAEGIIPEPEIERLKAMGRWLRTNGDAIYGTEAGPYRKIAGLGSRDAEGQARRRHDALCACLELAGQRQDCPARRATGRALRPDAGQRRSRVVHDFARRVWS